MTERDIILALKNNFKSHRRHTNNIYLFNGWESDFVSISQAGYTFEVEIKISRSDFRADFKKELRHWQLQNAKHERYTVGGKVKCKRMPQQSWVRFPRNIAPNRFYFAAPVGIIPVKKVPDYAGLIEVHCDSMNVLYCDIVRTAPMLHKRKQEDLELKILNNYYYKYWNLFEKQQ